MPDSTIWFYAVDGQRYGPTSEVELKALIAAGQVSADDLVWQADMANWAAVSTVPALAGTLQSAGTSFAGLTDSAARNVLQQESTFPQSSVNYYRAAIHNLPPRAGEALRSHGAPTGDMVTWPIDDASVQAFTDAAAIRQRIVRAAKLYHALLFFTVVFGTLFSILIAAEMYRDQKQQPGDVAMAVVICAAFIGVVGAVLFIAQRRTMYSKRTTSLVMTILFSMTGIASFLGIISAAMGSTRNPGAVMTFLGVFLGFAVWFAYVSFSAFMAIPKYLNTPAWCQELIAKIKI